MAQEERWLEMGYKSVEKANKAGVRLIIGDDFGTSWMPHGTYADELEFYVKNAGISSLDVIRWATRNGAGLLGMGDEIGTIETGKIADLLVINGDPIRDIGVLEDRTKLDVVMKGGELIESRLVPRPAIESGVILYQEGRTALNSRIAVFLTDYFPGSVTSLPEGLRRFVGCGGFSGGPSQGSKRIGLRSGVILGRAGFVVIRHRAQSALPLWLDE